MTARPTIGLFAIIFDRKGRILVKRRGKNESLPGDWDLPGGGVEVDANAAALDERVIGEELLREVREETGMTFPPIQRIPAMYPVVMKGGADWAFAIILGITDQTPIKGEWKFISPSGLKRMASASVGNRIVSGLGKRMHRLILRGFTSRDCPSSPFRERARKMLATCQKND